MSGTWKGEINMKNVMLHIEDNGNKEFSTIRELMETLESDLKWHKENGSEEAFMDTKIELQLCDIKGQIVYGKTTCVVGTVIDGVFVVTGNVDDVAYEVERENK